MQAIMDIGTGGVVYQICNRGQENVEGTGLYNQFYIFAWQDNADLSKRPQLIIDAGADGLIIENIGVYPFQYEVPRSLWADSDSTPEELSLLRVYLTDDDHPKDPSKAIAIERSITTVGNMYLERVGGYNSRHFRIVEYKQETESDNLEFVGEGGISVAREENTVTISNTDTNWKTLTLRPEFEPYTAGQPGVQYRKVGELVQVQGVLRTTGTLNSSSSGFIVGTLPPECAPKQQVTTVCQGSGHEKFLLTVTAAGNVQISRYELGDAWVDITTNKWLPFTCMYFAK